MCLDCRELNKLIIKYKYDIPDIDELLDEFHGEIDFTKFDLHLGYHQIRMNTRDFLKTIFRIQQGHYDFLVMPFVLTNPPSIFQGLMNSIFEASFRISFLVFFDDILMYNESWKDHVQHVDRVLKFLEEE